MAKFKITPTTTVAELKEQFGNEIGGTLRVYDGRSEAPAEATLVSLGAKEGELECRTSRTVGKFEEAFQKDLNLKVKVYTKDNWVKVLDGITLATAAELPNGMTKAKMEAYLSYQREDKEDPNEETKIEVAESNNIELFAKRFEDKYGYVDEEGAVIIDPIFDYANEFEEGLARVSINDKYGFIDKTGEFVIEPRFDNARYFNDGLAEAAINDKYGFIDKTGEFVIEPKFDSIEEPFSEDSGGLAKVCYKDKYGFIDKSGEFVIKPVYDYINGFNANGLAIFEIAGKAGFMDLKGTYVIPPIFDALEPFYDGLARAKTGGYNGTYGFIDMTGEFIIEPRFTKLPYYFDQDLIPAQIETDDDFKFGFIDKTGTFVIDPIYDEADEFIDGVAEVTLDEETFKIDMQGNRIDE